MTLNEIKQQLDSKRPLRIQGLLKRRKEALNEFLQEFFINWNENHDTLYADKHYKVDFDELPEDFVQTEAGLRRSFGDLYQIIKYYYPGTQIRTIRNLLYVDLFDEMPDGFRSSWCEETKQRMWYFDPSKLNK